MITVMDSPVGVMLRGAALMLDLLFNCLLALIASIIVGNETHSFIIVLVLSSLIYSFTLPLIWNGYTLGKRMMGIRIAPISGEKLTLKNMLIRECLAKLFLYSTGVIVFQLISIHMVSSRPDKRAIHDILSGTYVTSDFPE